MLPIQRGRRPPDPPKRCDEDIAGSSLSTAFHRGTAQRLPGRPPWGEMESDLRMYRQHAIKAAAAAKMASSDPARHKIAFLGHCALALPRNRQRPARNRGPEHHTRRSSCCVHHHPQPACRSIGGKIHRPIYPPARLTSRPWLIDGQGYGRSLLLVITSRQKNQNGYAQQEKQPVPVSGTCMHRPRHVCAVTYQICCRRWLFVKNERSRQVTGKTFMIVPCVATDAWK